jgi:hypothetical protein
MPPWPGLRYAVHFLSPGQGEAQCATQAEPLLLPALGRSRRWWHHALRSQAPPAFAGITVTRRSVCGETSSSPFRRWKMSFMSS